MLCIACRFLATCTKSRFVKGKHFRKYLAKKFVKEIYIDLGEGQSLSKALTLAGEQEASALLNNIDVDFITWPYNWKNPDLGLKSQYWMTVR